MDDLRQQGKDQEEALIGAVLRRPALYDELAEIVSPKDFGWRAFGEIWQSFANLREQGMVIDALTAGDELHRMGKLEDFGCPIDGEMLVPGFSGRASISQLRELGDPDSARSYAANVLDYANKHKLLLKFQESVYHAANGRKAADIVADVTNFMGGLALGGEVEDFMSGKDAIRQSVAATEEASSGKIKVVPTGLFDFDKLIGGGLREGRLYIIAGAPGDGKSAMLVTLANNISSKGRGVGLLSMEMSTAEQTTRLIAQLSGIASDRIESGKFTDEEWPIYYHAVEVAESLPILWDDTPSLTMPQLRQKARKMASKGAQVLLVDSLNLMNADMPKAMAFERINWLGYQLKILGRELHLPVVVAHHINREGQKSDGKPIKRAPILADLEQAGEKSADVVAFIYREDSDEAMGIRHLKVAKNRSGPAPRIVDLRFSSGTVKFESVEKRTEFIDND